MLWLRECVAANGLRRIVRVRSVKGLFPVIRASGGRGWRGCRRLHMGERCYFPLLSSSGRKK